MSSSQDLVLVTGASGYIALHVVQQLLAAGYRVRGTVRDPNNQAKTAPLRNLPNAEGNLELVTLDLNGPVSAFEEAARGCQYVLHTASPFPLADPKDEMEVIRPAVDGTVNMLKACVNVGGVRRVVVTSSTVSVGSGLKDKNLDESNWSDVEADIGAYPKSKTLAERAAWEYIESLEGDDKLEMAVVNPGFVLGPPLSSNMGTSVDIFKQLVTRKIPLVPKVSFPTVDVRDVASLHLLCMTKPEAAGKRHIAAAGAYLFMELADFMRSYWKPRGWNPPTMHLPYAIVWMGSHFSGQMASMRRVWDIRQEYDNSRSKALGLKYHDMQDTIDAMGAAVEKYDVIKPKRQP